MTSLRNVVNAKSHPRSPSAASEFGFSSLPSLKFAIPLVCDIICLLLPFETSRSHRIELELQSNAQRTMMVDTPPKGPTAGRAVSPSVTMKVERLAMRSWIACLLALIQVWDHWLRQRDMAPRQLCLFRRQLIASCCLSFATCNLDV